jgi:hypothetical protein
MLVGTSAMKDENGECPGWRLSSNNFGAASPISKLTLAT